MSTPLLSSVQETTGLILTHKASIGIIGLGYVGLPLACAFAEAGFNVLGFDVDNLKVSYISEGRSYLHTVALPRLSRQVDIGLLRATGDFARLGEVDVIIICVPTPLTKFREPDMSFILSTAKQVRSSLRHGQVVVLESTTYPGTTSEVILPILEESGLKVGKDFFLGFSPEREDPGNIEYSLKNTPKVVSGMTKACSHLVALLYQQVVNRVVRTSSTQAAEMVKLVENIYRSVNIALVNELKMLCHRMGLDIHEVLDAAATKPFGFQKFSPGPGLGGHCIPIDPFYLTWKAREYDFPTRFIELAGEVNTNMPYYVVQRVSEALNSKGKSLRNSSVLVLGVAYKRDLDDMRESPALKIIELLTEQGVQVSYHDPFFPSIPKVRHYTLDLQSVPLDIPHIKAADCILIATDHTPVDYAMVLEHAQLVVDSRNATKGLPDPDQKILQA